MLSTWNLRGAAIKTALLPDMLSLIYKISAQNASLSSLSVSLDTISYGFTLAAKAVKK